MDAADVVSILVTGFPHNYESFLSHTRDTGTYVFGGGSNSPQSYFDTTFDILRTTNKALGNFQPFKTINMNSQQMAKRLALQAKLQYESKDLSRLRGEYAALQDQIAALNTPFDQLSQAQRDDINAPRIGMLKKLNNDKEELEKKIGKREEDIAQDVVAGKQVGLRIYGADMALEIESAEGPDDENTSINRVRLKNELLQLRTQYRCKFNEDTNLFLVGDEYDKDLDLQAFVLNMMSSVPMWDSEYKHPWEICSSVAKTLDMEFFADSQGHIQFRFPRYNKVPLSLILKMILLQQKDSIQLYPTALESLFKTKYGSLKEEAQIIDLEIQIETILLGTAPTSSDTKQGEKKQTDENSYVAMGYFLSMESVKPDYKDLSDLLIVTRNNLTRKKGGNPVDINEQTIADAEKELAEYNDASKPNMTTNRLNKTNKIAQLIGRKQRITDVIAKMDVQSNKFGDLNVAKLRGTPLTADSIKQILNQFSDLVEDDYNDFLGPGSASRFIITDDRIINSTFTESDQNVFCRVDVTGEQNLLGEGAGQFGGLPMIWAGATDFDLWRQYGYRSYGPVHKPFFKSGPSQCAPYAQMLLTRAKKDAVRGSLTLVGNEYYQLGDVVYVNCRELLYYVTGIKHSFSYASGFTTTLDLRLGHPLGEYIPTPMDIIGKTMIKNNTAFNNVIAYRQTASKSSGSVVGVVKFDSGGISTSSDTELENMVSGAYSKFNTAQLKNALLAIREILGMAGHYSKVQIRGFSDSPADDNTAILRMDAVMSWLTSPVIVENGSVYPLSQSDFPPLKPPKSDKDSGDFEPFTDYNYPINPSKPSELTTDQLPSEMARSLFQGDYSSVVEIVMVFKPNKKLE
jgi:DNA-binding XRE family transcriptional regulator